MPLSSGPGSFQRNVRSLMHEVGKSPHVQSREQALAIAYAKERGRAEGGATEEKIVAGARALPMPQYISALDRIAAIRRAQQANPPPPPQQAQVRAEGGIIDHDNDEHLPRAQDHAQLVDQLPRGDGPMQLPPGYMEALLRLLKKQQAELYPFYRAWRGGFVGWR